MTIAEEVRAARAALGEDTATFGARWHRSGRTVEDWEQGRRNPDPLVREELPKILATVTARTKKKHAKKNGA
jgi:DNA-binding transcriptional regulator YiaG